MIDYLAIATRVLERWQTQAEPDPSPALSPETTGQMAKAGAVASAESEAARHDVWISWYEWKAKELNQLFLAQGVAGQPGRITAETVRHGKLHRKNKIQASTKAEDRQFQPECL
jgi:hypothetical protein